ncbi:MAPEG family protein [Shimia isoporae]|uniref:MAPEG family protein n=1 Tax=Shimia isoporae TaxID=647720 RepID=A0A4R1NQK2_9RHOB|nr:MAPEG family protein [Shimia isoporae]TCL08983.1 MAPEG family protein [Shimia isoporae]
MPTEIGILTCLMIFAASMWIPFIVGVNKYEVSGDSFARPADLREYPEWVHRAHRAHLNLLEQLLPFAGLVLILNQQDGFTSLTLWAAVVFFALRVAHAIGMISGIARLPVRPMIYLGGWVCVLLMAYSVFRIGFN